MGKQRITQLLAQLKENQAKDVENAAAIYTVAQVAVDALEQTQPSATVAALPAIPALDKAALLERYGSYNGCRSAAKKQGIRFSKTPSWPTLEAAFSYYEACQSLLQSYLTANPNPHLHGIKFEFPLEEPKP